MKLWNLGDIDLDQVPGAVQQTTTLVTQMRQVQTLSTTFVLVGQRVDRFQA